MLELFPVYSFYKPPFRVRSGEVAINGPGICRIART